MMHRLNSKKTLLKGSVFFSIFLIVIIVLIFLFGKRIHVFTISDEYGKEVYYVQRVETGAQLSHTFIHSVELCPLTEKWTLNEQLQFVLMESWNCSFGAGIAYNAEHAGTGAMKDGFYVIKDMNVVQGPIYMHPRDFTDHHFQIDDTTLNLSERFPNEIIYIQVENYPKWKYWYYKYQL
ncbi:DUF1850 domain-containing protein [Longirhabdus pacifica]|uniref:DUF1850 domain-containing protein n=1 Tax=Longirhabdus pacifica TaxID=2305227 RepID=UPI001008B210|nr:DUF1850 domain-containing protein [Longirhabdus pacifica]